MTLLSQMRSNRSSQVGKMAQEMGSQGEPERTTSDVAVLVAAASVVYSWYEFYVRGRRTRGIFVGLWPPTILAFASYLKQKSMERRLENSIVAGSTVRGLKKLLE